MRRAWWTWLGVLILATLVAGAALGQSAQEPDPAAEGVAADGGAASTEIEQNLQEILQEEPGPNAFRYDPQGRRDPFRSLIGPRQQLRSDDRPPGVPGFLIEEIALSGIVQTMDGMVALVKGPDNKGYTVRPGDPVFDGEVVSITLGSVIFRQEVNDPTRIERHREVVMELRKKSQ